MALSKNSLDDLIKPELLEEWKEIKNDRFPRTDTEEHTNQDRRTPGLFKVEWSGSAFIGLAAKSYFCYDKENLENHKYSSKGLNKSIQLTRTHFMEVLETKQASSFTNRGFIMKDGNMRTYNMDREGLPYFYCKRKVLEDGISTTYLDI